MATIIDNGDAGYSETGTGFTNPSGIEPGYGSDQRQLAASSTGVATWSFTSLTSGSYGVYATWNSVRSLQEDPSASTVAPYSVYDDTTLLEAKTVNQNIDLQHTFDISPPFDRNSDGRRWKRLGYYSISSGTLKVTLGSPTDARVFADAILIESVVLGTSSVTVGHPTVTSAGIFGFFFAGSSTKTIGHPTISAAGVRGIPTYQGSTTLSRKPTIATTDPTLIAFYRLEETTGTVATDSSGYGRDATYSSGAVHSVIRPPLSKYVTNRSVELSGGEKVTVPSTVLNSLAAGSNVAIALWIYARNLGTTSFMTVFDTTSRHMALAIKTNSISYGIGGFTTTVTGLSIPANQWHHIVLHRSGSNGGFWLNGTLVATLSVGSTFFQAIEFGNSVSGIGVSFDGFMDEIRIYSRSMSSTAEIAPLATGNEPWGGVLYPPKYTGTMPTRTLTHATASIAGSGGVPVYHGAATLSRHPNFGSLGGHNTPNFHGSTTLSRHPTFAATTTFLATYTASATLAIRGSEFDEAVQFGNLFVGGVGATASWMPLLQQAYDIATLTTPISVTGSQKPAPIGLNLVAKADPVPTLAAQAMVYVYGHDTNPVMVAARPIFIQGWDEEPVRDLNLFIEGWAPTPGTSGLINLAIRGGYASCLATAPLYLLNSDEGIAATVRLYIKGDGLTPGAVPIGNSMGLFIHRGPEAGITLFLENRGGEATLPLVLTGTPTASGSTTFFVKGLGDTVTGTVTLSLPLAHAANAASGQITLALPTVSGTPSASSTLYINGWTF